MSKYKGNGTRCSLCGGPSVACVDNFGQSYQGCPRCIIKDPSATAKATEQEKQ
jgi:hypothetical protein